MKNVSRSAGKNKEGLFTRETVGMVVSVFSVVLFLLLIVGDLIFGKVILINRFMFGTFGLCSFPFTILLFASGILIMNSPRRRNSDFLSTSMIVLAVLFAVMLVHTLLSVKEVGSFSDYISTCYNMGSGGVSSASGGGVLIGLLNFLPQRAFGFVGNIVFLSLAIVLCIFFAVLAFRKRNVKADTSSRKKASHAAGSNAKNFSKQSPKKSDAEDLPLNGFKEYPVDIDFKPEETENIKDSKHIFGVDVPFEMKTKRDYKKDEDDRLSLIFEQTTTPHRNPSDGSFAKTENRGSYASSVENENKNTVRYMKIPPVVNETEHDTLNLTDPISPLRRDAVKRDSYTVPPIKPTEDNRAEGESSGKSAADSFEDKKIGLDQILRNPERGFDGTNRESFGERKQTEENTTANKKPFDSTIFDRSNGLGRSEFGERNSEISERGTTPPKVQPQKPQGAEDIDHHGGLVDDIRLSKPKPLEGNQISINEDVDDQGVYKGIEGMPKHYRYNAPPLDLFKIYPSTQEDEKEYDLTRARQIEDTLGNLGVACEVKNIVKGPTITRFEVSIPPNRSVTSIPNKADDIKMRLSATSIRIEAPIPGKCLVGIEVPNKKNSTVGLREIVESQAYRKGSMDKLIFALGADVVGNPTVANLIDAPHLLVAGSTGMGKSVFLNCMLLSLIKKYSPEDLRLILVDPKQVEFSVYEGIPHLMFNQIITESNRVISMMNWAIDEMERRYSILRANFLQKIEEYNEYVSGKNMRKMPKIVIVIDEVADLMSVNKREIEERIQRLTQKARAAGIYLVCATQRPSVDVINGVIKNNIPSRVAFRVSAFEDSRTILGEGGAEQLLGNGDMIYKDTKTIKPKRIQGAYVSNGEIRDIIRYVKENNACYFDEAAEKYIINNAKKDESSSSGSSGDGEVDDEEMVSGVPKLYIDALEEVVRTKKGSISYLQRRFNIGFNRAAKIIDWMVDMGYFPPNDNSSKPRTPYLTYEQFMEIYENVQ